MSAVRIFFRYLVILVSILVVLLSLGSLIYDVSYWYAKVLDFPRMQYLIVALVCLPLFALSNRQWKLPAIALTLGLLSAILIQSLLVLPYLIGREAGAGCSNYRHEERRYPRHSPRQRADY